jgi:hypothetical protein
LVMVMSTNQVKKRRRRPIPTKGRMARLHAYEAREAMPELWPAAATQTWLGTPAAAVRAVVVSKTLRAFLCKFICTH